MSLGKKIYELRTVRKFSQSDLAELLDVSRQSISKWETDAATPDLDKLIKICDLFEISLDELAERTTQKNYETHTSLHIKNEYRFTPTKVVGLVLLVSIIITSTLLFALSDDIETFYIILPILISVLVCSIICLCIKNNIGYWCTWTALAPICVFSFSIMGLPLFNKLGGAHTVIYVFMAIVANKKFKVYPVQISKAKNILILIGYIICVITYLVVLVFIPLDFGSRCTVNYITYTALAIYITYTVCYIKQSKEK